MDNLNVYSLNEIKGKVNYQKSVIMVDDVGLDDGHHHVRGHANE